jgi:hypothetical protein
VPIARSRVRHQPEAGEAAQDGRDDYDDDGHRRPVPTAAGVVTMGQVE